jgi:ferredoxin
MPRLQPAVGQYVFLPKAALTDLVAMLRADGFTVVAPIVDQGVIAMRPIDSADQLARGLRDEHGPGHYRLIDADPELHFEYVVGPDSPKRHMFPPVQRLFKLHTHDGQLVFDAGPPQPPKLAMLGVRPCDLAALKALDRVFSATSRCESDPFFSRARQHMLIVVVNCTRPGGNCFCASMATGPQANDGFDLAMTELRAGFLVKIGSGPGVQLAAKLDVRDPSPAELELADLRLEQAREHMGRTLAADGVADLLAKSLDHPRWADVAKRCLACGNCTMVCPTCFCSAVADSNDLLGAGATRTRFWDSCFTHQFTYTTPGPVRASIRARYRHWLNHKLWTYQEQFGCSGCVGCGRCITWCPAGIDITEEVAAIRGGPKPPDRPTHVKTESEVVS